LEEKTQNRPTLVLLMVFREICSKHHLGLPWNIKIATWIQTKIKFLSHSVQASDHLLRQYPPIQHEDGLETSILGLEFEVTPSTFSSPSARKNRYDVNDEKNGGRSQVGLNWEKKISTKIF
jgi:hypothetical protein